MFPSWKICRLTQCVNDANSSHKWKLIFFKLSSTLYFLNNAIVDMRYNSHPNHSTLAINRAPYNTQLGQKLPIKPEIKCPLNLKLNGVIIKYRDVSYSILLCINNIRIVRRYDTCLTLASIRP